MTAEPEHTELRTRTIAHLHPEVCDDTFIVVEHVYEPDGVDTCHCGDPTHDPGMVGLVIAHGEEATSVMLLAEEALVLANRLTRAATLVLESMEDNPDIEREAARFTHKEAPAD